MSEAPQGARDALTRQPVGDLVAGRVRVTTRTRALGHSRSRSGTVVFFVDGEVGSTLLGPETVDDADVRQPDFLTPDEVAEAQALIRRIDAEVLPRVGLDPELPAALLMEDTRAKLEREQR
jgi:hypothetical protein